MLLVLIALGTVALDLTAQHGAQRAVHRVATSAADDAAAMIDTRQVQLDGSLRIDPAAARRVVERHLGWATLPGPLVGPIQVEVSPDGTAVTVRVAVRAPRLLLPARRDGDRTVRATVTARLRS
ncbi:MAG: hypothetical protein ACYC2O_10570 [Microthrixaceae bacterium]